MSVLTTFRRHNHTDKLLVSSSQHSPPQGEVQIRPPFAGDGKLRTGKDITKRQAF